MTVPEHSLVAWLGAVAAAQPGDPAIISDGRTWSYRELWDRSGALARQLLAHGTAPGESVGIIGENEAEYVSAYLGVMRAGATAVPLNAMLDAASIRDQLDLVRARVVLAGMVRSDIREALAEGFVVWPLAGSGHSPAGGALPDPGPGDPCSIMLTSGSTGRPKGAVHSHATMLHAALQLGSVFPFGRGERGMVFLPLYACIPELVLPMLCMGGALEVLPGFDLDRIADACTEATMFDAVPTAMSRLIEHVPADRLARLSWVLFASEVMPPPLLQRWWDELPGVQTWQLYGMTEILPLTAATPSMMRAAPTTVGRAFPTTSITVRPIAEAGLPAGEGELLGATPACMRGYYDNPEATAAAVTADGLMHTGDIGRVDDRGLVFLTGRHKDIIISGGMNISPREIEEVATRHPAVATAVVMGVPSERWGETPVVVAVPREGQALAAADLLAFCRDGLASFKRPSAAAVVDSLPTTGIGKAAKDSIRRQIIDGEITVVHA